MSQDPNTDPFDLIRKAGTSAPNFDMHTPDIIARLQKWQALCQFRVINAGGDRIEIKFDTFPADMDAFVRDVYDFCPDLVDQGTGCVAEMIEEMGEVPPEMQKLVEGVDFKDENYGLEILKRELQMRKNVTLWWD
jgi:Domain of unknown function (DUF4253)